MDANFDNDDKEDNQTGAAGDKKITSVGLKDAIKKTGEKGEEEKTDEDKKEDGDDKKEGEDKEDASKSDEAVKTTTSSNDDKDDQVIQDDDKDENVKDDAEEGSKAADAKETEKKAGAMTNDEKKEIVDAEPVKRADYSLLDELTNFLYTDEDPLPILCGYFHKIMDQLLLK